MNRWLFLQITVCTHALSFFHNRIWHSCYTFWHFYVLDHLGLSVILFFNLKAFNKCKRKKNLPQRIIFGGKKKIAFLWSNRDILLAAGGTPCLWYMVFLRGYVMSNHLAGYLKFNSSIVYNVYLLSSCRIFYRYKGGCWPLSDHRALMCLEVR